MRLEEANQLQEGIETNRRAKLWGKRGPRMWANIVSDRNAVASVNPQGHDVGIAFFDINSRADMRSQKMCKVRTLPHSSLQKTRGQRHLPSQSSRFSGFRNRCLALRSTVYRMDSCWLEMSKRFISTGFSSGICQGRWCWSKRRPLVAQNIIHYIYYSL